MEALKHNACMLKNRIEMVNKNACDLTGEVKSLNNCLTQFYDLLCYAQYGIKHMDQRLLNFRAVSNRIVNEFPCFEKQINEIAQKDATMICKLQSLLIYCLDVAYNSLILAQRIIWTCATVGLQVMRLQHMDSDLSHLKKDLNVNWDLLSRLKGGHTFWHSDMCTTADLSTLKGGKPMVSGFRSAGRSNAVERTFRPVIDTGMGDPVLNCVKYFWVLLCFIIFMRYFSWFGIQDVKGGSMVLVTLFTGLSAFHLTMAVRGIQFQSVASRRGGGKTATYINTVMLLGLIVFFVISWISNIVSTYSGMMNSLNHVTQRLRIVGIYDSDSPKGRQLLFQTMAETFNADIHGLRGLWTINLAKEADIMPGFGRKLAMTKAVKLAGSGITNLGGNDELAVTSFLYKMKDSSFVTLKWVLDALGFVYLYPEHVQMLNRATARTRSLDIGIPLLWSAWSTRTHINDSVILRCHLCKEALLKLNDEYLSRVEKIGDIFKKIKFALTWNTFYDIQYKDIGEHCMRYQQNIPVYTELQKDFVRDEFSRWYVSQWEKYHTGLWKFAKKLDEKSHDFQDADKSDVKNISDLLKYLSRTYLSHDSLKMYKQSFVMDSALEAGENHGSDTSKMLSLDGDCAYEGVTDVTVMLVHAQSWKEDKEALCGTMGALQTVCLKVVESVMSKLEDFIGSGNCSVNLVEQFYRYAFEDKMEFIIEESKTMYMKQPYVSQFLKEDSELVGEKMSLFSFVKPDDESDGENNISDKYRDDIKHLLEVEDSDNSWWRVLYWLGTWSIFHPVPISQGDMRYLLL